MTRTKKRIIGLGTAAVLLVGAGGVAFAYFTNSGTGTGTATVGTSSAITVLGSAAGSAYPGGAAQEVSFLATNPGSGHQLLNVITFAGVKACPADDTWNPDGASGAGCYLTAAPYTYHSNAEISTCESSSGAADNPLDTNWYMAPVSANQDFAAGASGVAVTAKGSLVMNNLASSQDSCKLAHLYLTFTTS